MARRSRRQARPPNKSKGKRNMRRSRRRSRRTTVGQLVTSGVRTLVGFLPGASYFKDIADFALKALNVATSVEVVTSGDKTKYVFEGTHQYGMRGMFLIGSRNLIVSSSVGVRAGLAKDTSSHFWRQCAVDFDQVMTTSLVLSLVPEGQAKNRAGLWHFGYQAAYDLDGATRMQQFVLPPEYTNMKNFTRYASGPADKPLRLRWNVSPSDGAYCNSYRPPGSDVLGLVCIYFEDHSRDTAGEMQNSEFACSVHVSGTFRTRNTRPETANAGDIKIVQDICADRLPKYGTTVMCGGEVYHLDKSYSHTKQTNGTYKIIGHKLEVTNLSLDELSISE